MKHSGTDRKKSIPLIIFISIEAILYITYMYTDILLSSGQAVKNTFGIFDSSMIKYYSIIICLGVSAFVYYRDRQKSAGSPKEKVPASRELAAAMLFTAVSDYFLLLNPGYIQYGLLSFCVVHAIYLYVIYNGNLKKSAITTLLRLGAAAVISFVLLKTDILRFSNDSYMPALVFLILVYGISFAGNILILAGSLINKKKDCDKKEQPCLFNHPGLFLIGLILFILCDINVLIYNLSNFFSISSSFYISLRAVSALLMWGFYLPSQVVIVMSCILPSGL